MVGRRHVPRTKPHRRWNEMVLASAIEELMRLVSKAKLRHFVGGMPMFICTRDYRSPNGVV